MSQPGKLLFASLALLALPCPNAHARGFESGQGFHAVQRLGVTLGGNVISEITREDGSIREISAGGLYQIGAGVLYQAESIPFSGALILNYHYNSDYKDNDNASFRRVPLEALVYFNGPGRFRIGGGMRYVYSARANSTLNGVTEKITFRNARGSIVEIGYQVRPYGWVSLRHVKETYQVATYASTGTAPGLAGNTPYDGSHTGFFIGYEY
ncbi:MAG: hypothetical protein Q7U91_11740 [Sideroxyarcus sp.]|nr:hypothetical protein [Sideroxyarcus sp.]